MMPLNEVPFSWEHFKISWRSFADVEPFSPLAAAVVNAFQAVEIKEKKMRGKNSDYRESLYTSLSRAPTKPIM